MLERVDATALTAWALSKPCQVGPLLDVLVSRMDREEDAFEALASVLRCFSIFDVFLQKHSSALETLYSTSLQVKATQTVACKPASQSSEATATQVLEPSVMIGLPHILPSTCGLPSSFYAYIEHVIQGGKDETLGQWQVRLGGFFADAPLEILCGLPEATIQLASNRLKTLLRSKNFAENLYAAYITCRLQRHGATLLLNASSPGTCPVACPTLRAWIERCHSTFRDSQCIQAVKMTLMRVLALTCSEDCRNVENADSAIALAGDFLSEARKHYTGDWANDTFQYTRKLAEKFGGMHVRLQVAVIHVFAVLEPQAWLFDAVNICTKGFQILTAGPSDLEPHLHHRRSSAETVLLAADRCMALASPEQSEYAFAPFIEAVYTFIIEQCQPSRTVLNEGPIKLTQALRFVEALQSLVFDGSSTFMTALLQAAEAIGVPEWWTLNLTTHGTPENCSGLLSCVHHEEIQRQRLCDQVTLLLFTCGSSSTRQLPRSTIEIMRQRLTRGCLGDERPSCVYHPFVRTRRASIPSHRSDITSLKWREYLDGALKSSNSEAYSLIEKIVKMVCKDLEDRCETVEVPLLAALDKVHEMTTVIQQMENKISDMAQDRNRLEEALRLQQEAHDRDTSVSAELEQMIANLKQEMSGCEQQIAQLKSDRVLANEQAQNQLDEVQQKAREDMETAQEQHETRVCELEAQLSSQVQANSALEHESAWLKEQTDLARKELADAHTQQIEKLTEQHAVHVDALNSQISQMQQQITSNADELEHLRNEMQAREQSNQELARLRDESEQQLSQLQSELQTVAASKSAVSTELAEAQTKNKDLSTELAIKTGEMQKQAQRIGELESLAARSQQRCAKLESALAEARSREEGISALLAGAGRASGLPGRRTRLAPAVQNRTSTQGVGDEGASYAGQQQSRVRRLPEQSFVSDDDDDYYEIMKLPEWG